MDGQDLLPSIESALTTIDSIKSHAPTIARVADRLTVCFKSGNKLLVCGNGGSASDSQHLVAELIGRFLIDKNPRAAIDLSSNSPLITAICNDYGVEESFSRQVQGLGNTHDVLFAISTSGNSANVLNAVTQAKKKGIYTIGLLGKGGGKIKAKCDLNLIIDSESTPRIQEAHIVVIHLICQLIDQSIKS